MREKRTLAFEALDRALERAARHNERAFAALAEALWWVCVLNDSFWKGPSGDDYVARREGDERGPTLVGLRYARNRLTHDLDLTGMHGLIGGVDLPANFPLNFGGWVWRRVDDVAPTDREDANGEGAYRRCLEGHKVEATLRTARDFLVEYSRSS
ncbi:MAG: hypothetical protein QY307_02805 [Acidimicrobiia bacterium]|nr:MAG: hypothetical protein QY307_02805 [Acidimicrobiia bacterium]